MNAFKENIQAMKLKKSQLYENFIKYKKTTNDEIILVESIVAKDKSKIITINMQGINHRLNSIYSPYMEAERWVEQFQLNNHQIVISFFGIGNGIFVRKLIEKMRAEDRIIIFEPSIEIFDHAMKEYDFTDILKDDRVMITVNGINENDFHLILSNVVDWVNVNSQILCSHPIYDQIFIVDYKYFLQEISNNNTKCFLNRNTAAKMGKAMVKNTIHNFRYLKNSNTAMELYEVIPKDIPVIIVAAGPSLDGNIDELKNLNNKAIIIATDRALEYLFAHNIEPHFIVTLDAIKPLKYFSNRDNITIPLLCKLESNHEILDFHRGRKIWYDSHPFFNKIYEDLGKPLDCLSSGGSVATAAFSICVALGIKRIILIGQDLAYSGEYTHAGGITGEGHNETNIAGFVEDIHGNMVPTRYDWKMFLLWFQDAIANYPEIDVIDATEGGAKISGTKIMTLKEAISQFCNIDISYISQRINNLEYSLNNAEYIEFIDYIERGILDLDIIKDRAKKLEDYCEELILACKMNKIHSNSNQKILRNIAVYNKEIKDKDIYMLVDTYIADSSAEHLTNIYQFSGDKENDMVKTYRKAKHMYNSIANATLIIKELLLELTES